MSSSPNYESEFCGKVPIHLINMVQSYGALLVIDRRSLQVIQASENIEQLSHQPVENIVGTPIRQYLDEKSLAFLQQVAVTDKVPQIWTIDGRQFQVISARILSLQNKERHEFATHIQSTYTKLIGQVYEKQDLAKGLMEGDTTPLKAEAITDITSGRIVFEKDEKNYHPRHSFKLWRQIVSGSSLSWKEEELAIGSTLRSFLYEFTNK